jgi:iron(III) transport system permease protein
LISKRNTLSPNAGPRRWTSWSLASGVIALLVLAPVLALLVVATGGSADLWTHLIDFVLPVALRNTLVLLLGVGVLTALLGTGTAWLVTAYEFPGRRLFDWALLLPLAVPTYIIAYAYLDIMHPVGPVQTVLRALLGIDSPRDFRLPDIRSMTGCILLLGFVLYPYVYLSTRAMFLMQAANLIDVARTLGSGRAAVFFRVVLPLARPALVIGVSLVLLETLNDIGAAEFLGVRTLTVSVYTTWVSRSDLPGAAQIALAMLVVIIAVIMLERWARRQRRYANDAQQPRPLRRLPLQGAGAVMAWVTCALPVLLGFVVPASYLIDASASRIRFAGIPANIIAETFNTLTVAGIATALTLVLAFLVAYAARLGGSMARALLRVASLGYAVPGAVLAIGLLPVITSIERGVHATSTQLLGIGTGLFLLGSGAAIVCAYVVRFLAIPAGSIESGFNRVSPSMDAAARMLGKTAGGTL